MVPVIVGVGVAALLVGGVAGMIAARSARPDPEQAPLLPRVAALELRVEGLPGLWESAVERAQEAMQREYRHAQRASEAERRTRERIEESDGQPEAGPDVRQHDAFAGAGNGVQPVREDVASARPAHLARAYELGYPWI